MHQRTATFYALVAIVLLAIPAGFLLMEYQQARDRYFAPPPEPVPVKVFTEPDGARDIYVPPAPVLYPIY